MTPEDADHVEARSEWLELLAAATDRVLTSLRAAVDALEEPSRLPGWTRAHVATHLARNADSFTWMLDGAAAGEQREQYPGGPATRAAAIDAGSRRPGVEVVSDVRRAAERFSAACTRMPEAAWSFPVLASAGEVPAAYLIWARLREVEVHHTDLGLRYAPADWPGAFIDAELPRRLDALADRLPRGTAARVVRVPDGEVREAGAGPASLAVSGPGYALLAWLLGRDATGLDAPGGLPPLAAW
ncbi:MAG TPA: maleylpyruvate isomerase family mycothiol-dependent enzyme [Acidimicrobiales bacterium]|nr:maleylpyruvate isomerase family mycothiol-dependent enzyme [Acidimicrobiales bacterium]